MAIAFDSLGGREQLKTTAKHISELRSKIIQSELINFNSRNYIYINKLNTNHSIISLAL